MCDLPELALSEICAIPLPDGAAVDQALEKAFLSFHKKVVVLDDDPTGTQTVHHVPVYTDWSLETLEQIMGDTEPVAFILTNSRSFSKDRTIQVHKEIAANLAAAAKKYDQEFLLISRGDSTLRGHYPLETQVLKETFEEETALSFDGEIFCPYFGDGGRYTVNNIHYVCEGEKLIPAGQTEFAKDRSFGYKASDLREYIEEKSDGMIPASQCVAISLQELRQCDYDGITKKLMDCNNFQKVIVNAAHDMDLKVFMTCWIRAMAHGKNYLARSAASLTRIAGHVSLAPLLTRQQLRREDGPGGLVIIGSHVQKTTRQLKCLMESKMPLCFLEFHADSVLGEDGLKAEADRILNLAREAVLSKKTAVIYTSRRVIVPHSENKDQILELSVRISQALTGIVSRFGICPAFIIAKGGITSSDVATRGLGIKKAMVMGQVKKGIPVWLTGGEAVFPNMPYIIFPGNVGNEETLREIVELLL